MGFKMKPVNRNLADEFHEESREGIDAVFERMWQVAGKAGSFNEAFDVSQNTIKTWRRRGAVSTKFLQGFADKHGTTLDYLMYGERGGDPERLVLDDTERTLIRAFRAAPKELRDAALRVLRGDGMPPSPNRVRIGGSVGQLIEGDAKQRDVKIKVGKDK